MGKRELGTPSGVFRGDIQVMAMVNVQADASSSHEAGQTLGFVENKLASV